ncbi:MAG: SH3 domain-containing protein [Aristaeellaceae bacterium]
MKWNRLLAVALALVVLVTGTGVFAFAQGADGLATPTEVSDGENAAEPMLLSDEGESSAPGADADDGTSEDGASADPEDADTGAGDAQPEATQPAASSGNEAARQPEDGQQDASSAVLPGNGAHLPENAGSADTDAFVSAYAYIPEGTVLYSDRDREEELGVVTKDAVMLVRELAPLDPGTLYEAFFDTEETAKQDSCEHAYFDATDLQRPDREQTEVCIAKEKSYRTLNHVKVFTAEFRYTEKPEETEEPGQPEEPEQSGTPDRTDRPGEAEQSGKPEKTDDSEKTDAPVKSDEPGQTDDPQQPEQPGQPVSRVNTASVNMRREPDVKARLVAKLHKDTPVEVLSLVINETGEAWYSVRCEGQEGYIRADLVDVVGVVPGMPAANEPEEEIVEEIPAGTEIDATPESTEEEETEEIPADTEIDADPESDGGEDETSGETDPDADPESDDGEDETSGDEDPDADPESDDGEDETSGDEDPDADPESDGGEDETSGNEDPDADSESDDGEDETSGDEDPDADSESDDGTSNGTETDASVLYTISYYNFAGESLLTSEVAAGETLDEEFFLGIQGDGFLGWYLCDENGNVTGETPFVFGQPVESDTYLRACSVSGQSAWDDAALEEETFLEAGRIEPERRVDIAVTRDTDTLQLGSQITLTASLTGYEETNYTCRWQYAAADRSGNIIGEWQDAPVEELSYTYTLSEENLLTAWRMCVTIVEP